MEYFDISYFFRTFATDKKTKRMKSIKEKVEELVEKRVELSREESIAYFQGIEEGANYVLGILETELPLEDNRNLNDYGKALVWRLKNCIEQLKK